MTRIVDMNDPSRVGRTPDKISVLLQSGPVRSGRFVVERVELRLYCEGGSTSNCLITSFVQTDCGSVEMVYDEGSLGDDPLLRAAYFLSSELGLSQLVQRSLILLDAR